MYYRDIVWCCFTSGSEYIRLYSGCLRS